MIDSQSNPDKLSKAESSRINGSKSNGPATESGRANSANANLRHGAYSKRVLLDNEDASFYENFKTAHLAHFRPTDPMEFQCVESMISAAWRIRRLESAETRLLNIALASNKAEIDAKFEPIDPPTERAIAVESKVSEIESLTRIQERLHRIYDRNFKLLVTARKKSGRPVPDSGPELNTAPPAPKPPEPSDTPKQTIDPTATAQAKPPAAAILSQLIIFLVIFAMLFAAPLPITATFTGIFTEKPAFYAGRSCKSHHRTHQGAIK